MDTNFDGVADIVVGAGTMGGSQVEILDDSTRVKLTSFQAFPTYSNLGLWTAGGTAPLAFPFVSLGEPALAETEQALPVRGAVGCRKGLYCQTYRTADRGWSPGARI